MLLNSAIFAATIDAAKASASASPAWLRAIDRAVIEIERSPYWSYADGTLTLISTTSNKTYKIDESHTCEAKNGICKHRAARKLIQRYLERLAAVDAKPKQEQTAKPQADPRETAVLIKRQGNALRIGC